MTYRMIGGPHDGEKANQLTPIVVVVDRVPFSYGPRDPWRVGYYMPLVLLLATETRQYTQRSWIHVGGRREEIMVFEEVSEGTRLCDGECCS